MDQKPEETNEEQVKSIDAKIKELKKEKAMYKNGESFSIKKLLKGMFSLLNPVEWAKTLREIGILDVRKWIIYALIIGSIYGYGYIKGIGNKPVYFDMRGKEAHIALNEHTLHILPDGNAQVEEKDGTILKKIKTKDIPELRKALKPVGIDINPFFTAGIGVGNKKVEQEAGAGLSIFKFYKIHLDTWLTNRGIYLGSDYQITNNFGIIGGTGKGYTGYTRIYFGGKWKF